MWNFHYKIALIICLMFCNFKVFATDVIDLYLIKDQKYLGDYNQLLGIAKNTKEYFAKQNIVLNVQEYNFAELKSPNSKIKNTKKPIILLSANLYGIEAIKLFKANNSTLHNILAIHLSHQVLNKDKLTHAQLVQTKDNKSGADIIVLPSHAISSNDAIALETKYTKLVQTIGVAHNLEQSEINKEYIKFKDIFPKASKYIGVILGGDAPDSNGKVNYYTESDAQKLAEYVSNLAIKQNGTVLITNSPRTGKYDHKTNKERTEVHQNDIMDPVTSKFQEILVENKVKFKLFDFQKNKPSLYKGIVGAVLHNPSSIIFVPGESTSMISECLDILPGLSDTLCKYDFSICPIL